MLFDWSKGDKESQDQLIPIVYDELHRLAHRYLRRERPDHTLQTTALVHEAYLRLVGETNIQWQSRAHFFRLAATLMRRILVDHARSHHAAKRGAEQKISIHEAVGLLEEQGVDLVALDDALKDLAAIDPQQGSIVELRFFGGLKIEEAAEVLRISPRTVKRRWGMAKAWLHREMTRSSESRE